MNCAEYRDWIAADVDGALGADEGRVRAHVEGCSVCRARRTGQAHVRSLLRSRPLDDEAPFGLRTRILARIDEGAASRGAGAVSARLSRWAALVVTGLAAFLVLAPPRGVSLDPMVDEYYAALRGEIPLSIRTDSVTDLERFYGERTSDPLPSHVVDLEAAGFRLVGGVVREVAGRPRRLSVYSDGRSLIVCDYRRVEEYRGELQPGAEPLFFSRAGLTFCVRRMGDEVCILVTRLPMHVVVPRLLGWT